MNVSGNRLLKANTKHEGLFITSTSVKFNRLYKFCVWTFQLSYSSPNIGRFVIFQLFLTFASRHKVSISFSSRRSRVVKTRAILFTEIHEWKFLFPTVRSIVVKTRGFLFVKLTPWMNFVCFSRSCRISRILYFAFPRFNESFYPLFGFEGG